MTEPIFTLKANDTVDLMFIVDDDKFLGVPNNLNLQELKKLKELVDYCINSIENKIPSAKSF